MRKINNLFFIHVSFFIYSLASFFSKFAGSSNDKIHFIIFYGCSFLCLGIYALAWQKILKNNSLIYAYLNKGITLFWGLLFGFLFFQEQVKINMIIGIFIVIFGVLVANKEEKK